MISVVMPCYNGSKFIAEAIESILGQTYKDFEFIIVDDGSTDGSLELIRRYAEKDGRIRILSTPHLGISAALNLGILEARCEWIARMDADDVAFPQRLQRQMEEASKMPQVVLWGSYAYHIGPKGKIMGLQRVGPICEDEFYKMRKEGAVIFFTHPTSLMKKDALLKAGGYDPKFSGFIEDIELFSRMSVWGPLLTIPEPLLYYRFHEGNQFTRKYLESLRVARYIRYRNQAILRSEIIKNYDQYLETEKKRSLVRKMMDARLDHCSLFYRSAASSFCCGRRSRAVSYFLAAWILRPIYSIQRLWGQKFSRIATMKIKKEREKVASRKVL